MKTRITGRVVMAVAAGVLGAAAPAWGLDAEEPQPQQQTITIRGEPMKVWPFEDLQERGFDVAEVPRDENAFWTYLEALNGFKDVPDEAVDAFEYAYRTAWPKGHDAKVKAYLLDPANQKAMSLARQASAMEKFQSYYFGDPRGSIISVLLPSLSPYRHVGKMLVADGRRLEEQGAYDLAFRNYVTVMRIGHHVANGITLIEDLVGVACWNLGDQAVAEMVLRRDLPRPQLQDIVKTLEELAPLRPSLIEGVAGERLFGNLLVDEIISQPTQVLRNVSAMMSYDGVQTNDIHLNNGWRRLEARLGQVFLPDRTIKKHMNAYYDQLEQLARSPIYSDFWREFNDEALVLSIPPWDVVSRMFLPSLTRALLLNERSRMETRLTRTVVALRLFSLEHKGAAPAALEELDDLVPEEVRVDPFSGDEFVYNRTRDGWTLYSLADNQTDDGGKVGERAFDLDFVRRYPAEEVEPFAPEDTEQD